MPILSSTADREPAFPDPKARGETVTVGGSSGARPNVAMPSGWVTDPRLLLRDPHVEQWYRALGDSGLPAEEYLEGLHRFVRHARLPPSEIARLPASVRATLIERFENDMEALGHDARKALAALEHWLGFQGRR